MSKYEGGQVILQWDRLGGTAWVTIGQVIDLGGPTLARNAIDSTTRDVPNYWRTFLRGYKDAGELTFNVAYDPSLATHGSATGLIGDFNQDSGTIFAAFRMEFPDATESTFDGFLTGFEETGDLDALLTADVTVKISGQPVLP